MLLPHERKEPLFNGRTWQFPFEWHATAMGYLIKEFANLEFSVGSFFQQISGYPTDEVRIILDAAGNGMAGRRKLAYAYSVLRAPTDEWLNDVKDVLKSIENLGTKRNHIFHHWWLTSDAGYSQINDSIKIKREDDRYIISDPIETEVDTQALWNLTNDIMNSNIALSHLIIRYRNPSIKKSDLPF